MIVPPDSYWPEIQRICREYGILLIADEVICGFGRTGRWFGCEHFGIEPDFLTIAKGLTSGYQPLGGVMVGDRVAEVLIGRGGEFHHGYTWSGHPVACAVALANLAIVRRERLVERGHVEIGPYLQRRWRELADHPLVGEVRGVGMLGALDWLPRAAAPSSATRGGRRSVATTVSNGLVMRGPGHDDHRATLRDHAGEARNVSRARRCTTSRRPTDR